MGRVLYIIWAVVVTAVVTSINVNDKDDGTGNRSSYRSWGSGNSYSGSGGFHK